MPWHRVCGGIGRFITGKSAGGFFPTPTAPPEPPLVHDSTLFIASLNLCTPQRPLATGQQRSLPPLSGLLAQLSRPSALQLTQGAIFTLGTARM
jgi:hypothetical protein